MEIPTEEDWQFNPANVNANLDEAWAYKNFHGKTFDEAVRLFEENVLHYQEDLTYMPGRVFDFYLRAFIAYLMSDGGKDDLLGASCFLDQIRFKAKYEPETIRPLWPVIEPALKHVVELQERSEEEWSPYRNFRRKVHEIVKRGFPVSFPTPARSYLGSDDLRRDD
jgi:hypothetical protein